MSSSNSLRPDFALQQSLRESESRQEESWMLSYIDVFVLMTTIFVMIFVLSKQNIAANPAQKHVTEKAEVELLDETNLAYSSALMVPEDWSDSIEKAIADHGLESFVELRVEPEFTELEVESNVLFSSGLAELSRPGDSVLNKLLPVLQSTTGMIFIEGHADDRPISTSEFPSNWELAAARADEVLKYYVSQDIAPSRLRAVSYGDTKPLVANDSDVNRERNRRVSIMIQTPKS